MLCSDCLFLLVKKGVAKRDPTEETFVVVVVVVDDDDVVVTREE